MIDAEVVAELVRDDARRRHAVRLRRVDPGVTGRDAGNLADLPLARERAGRGRGTRTITLSQVSASMPVAVLNSLSAWLPHRTSSHVFGFCGLNGATVNTSPSLRSLPVSETWPNVSSWRNAFAEFGAVKMMLRIASASPDCRLTDQGTTSTSTFRGPGVKFAGPTSGRRRPDGRWPEPREVGADDGPARVGRVAQRRRGCRARRTGRPAAAARSGPCEVSSIG